MRASINNSLRSLLGLLMVIGLLCAFIPLASAQQVAASECAQRRPSEATPTSSLAANEGHLLTRDGSGFFSQNLSTIAVRSAHIDQESVTATTNRVAQELIDFYFGSTVEVFVNEPGKSTRAVIVDGDTAVPGQPTVFTIGGVPTLFLHWTTAETDIDRLLDVPSFKALGPNNATLSSCSSAAMAGTSDEPNDVLAYVDETRAASPLAPTPLADTAPIEQWPFGVTAAAVLVATGGVVLQRRDKIWGDRFTPTQPSAEALIEAGKPRMPMADLPPARPRVIFLDERNPDGADAAPAAPRTGRQIDLQVRTFESPLAKVMAKVSSDSQGPVLPREEFARLVNTEWSRHKSGGADGAVASLVLSELDAVRLRLGNNAADSLFDEVANAIAELCRPLDVLGLSDDNELAILMADCDEPGARAALDEITKKIASRTFSAVGERVLLTPATGYALLSDTKSAPELIRAVESARSLAMMNLHLDPERWDPSATPLHSSKGSSEATPSRWAIVKEKLTTPAQIGITLVIAWVLPFLAYVGLDSIGIDISYGAYLVIVASLVITGAFILAEAIMAMKQKEPPAVPSVPYPKATALIAAYMPNEAATVIETIDSFLAIDYPNDLQIILAYNTPDPLPVEEHLDRIAAEHPNFVPVRIVGSNSKAQNVNAALSMAEGEFIGMFDADHQPRPDAFTRAWRWIDDGYDVVQGHCLTRNGDAGWLAKMIAVEFESIYAVAHPGRAKMHRFGVFGGSNGFWRTELLHETRMRGSMLTEDIDSSMRVIERGFKIRSDRDLVSRELATTTFEQVWNQRMRWAQGWFQVSIEHVKFAFKSKELSVRQKMGVFHLLMWREAYPWLSQQLFPLLAFWAFRAGGVGRLEWTFPIFLATSIFTFCVGPLQTFFAYWLADPEIKQHKKWFWGYLLFTTPFYTEYKNLIARVAHVKQFMGESDWRVTPRSEDPVPGIGD